MSFGGKRQPRPSAGNLRNPFSLYLETRTPDGRGGFNLVWTFQNIYWSMSVPPTKIGKAFWNYGRERHTQLDFFLVRRDGLLDTRLSDQYRMEYDGERYQVIAISNYEFLKDFYLIVAERWGNTRTPAIVIPPSGHFYNGTWQYNGAINHD